MEGVENNNKHLKPAELAARLRVSIKTLAHWRCKGEGPRYLKVGGRILYPQDEVAHYELACERGSTAECAT